KLCFIIMCLVLAIDLVGCKSAKPIVNQHIIKDSTIINYVPVEVPVPGQMATGEVNLDSLLNLLKQNKPIEINKNIPSSDGKMNLKYWIDELGKLQIRCETQDYVLNVLAQEITRIRNEQKTETVIHTEHQTPFWNYLLMVLLGAALII